MSWQLDGDGGPGRGGLQAERLQIVDGEAQDQRWDNPSRGLGGALPRSHSAHIMGTVIYGEPGQAYGAAAVLFQPASMRALERQDFRLQPGRQRVCVALGDRRRHEWRPPRRIGLGARIVIGKIDYPNWPAILDQHAERSQEHRF